MVYLGVCQGVVIALAIVGIVYLANRESNTSESLSVEGQNQTTNQTVQPTLLSEVLNLTTVASSSEDAASEQTTPAANAEEEGERR